MNISSYKKHNLLTSRSVFPHPLLFSWLSTILFIDREILRFHHHAINTAQKNKSETIHCKKPRKWNITKDYYINNLSRSQVFVAHSFWVICRNISHTFIELSVSVTLYGDALLVDSLVVGNQQKHLEFTFSVKALPFHTRASIRAHKHTF